MRFPTFSKASDQPAHMHSLIRAFASRLNILRVLATDCKLKRRLHRLVWVYTRQNATLSRGSFMIYWLRANASHALGTILASSQCVPCAGYIHISKKRKNLNKCHKSSFSCMQCTVSCSSSLKLFFFSCKPMKRRHN